MPRAYDRAIQYAAASRFDHWRLWNTGSPGQGFERLIVTAETLSLWRDKHLVKLSAIQL